MRTYRGERSNEGVSVIVTQEAGGVTVTYPLHFEQPRLLVRSWQISGRVPDQFEWGFHGSAPAVLALAILLDATHSIKWAKLCYESFERQHVACWGDRWEITSSAIASWIASSGLLASASAVQGGTSAQTVPPDLRDPTYVPMIAEALADPQGFLEGMTETPRVVTLIRDVEQEGGLL